MSAVIKVAIAAGMAALIARAFFGPPPARRHGGSAVVLGVAGGVAYAAGILFALTGPAGTAAALLGVGSVAMAWAVWCVRAVEEEAAPEVEEPPEPVPAADTPAPLWDHGAPRP